MSIIVDIADLYEVYRTHWRRYKAYSPDLSSFVHTVQAAEHMLWIVEQLLVRLVSWWFVGQRRPPPLGSKLHSSSDEMSPPRATNAPVCWQVQKVFYS